MCVEIEVGSEVEIEVGSEVESKGGGEIGDEVEIRVKVPSGGISIALMEEDNRLAAIGRGSRMLLEVEGWSEDRSKAVSAALLATPTADKPLATSTAPPPSPSTPPYPTLSGPTKEVEG